MREGYLWKVCAIVLPLQYCHYSTVITVLPLQYCSLGLTRSLSSTQPWYEHLESLRYLLPEEEFKDKATGEAWPTKLMRLAERQLDALAADETRYKCGCAQTNHVQVYLGCHGHPLGPTMCLTSSMIK